ncbi:hypothetical protein O1D97_07075 [Marinomonas sp. 15G1-11]|uniref:Phage protein n=1 Tax=Marinomonas phaeophyticola TaxID=3004091 RepID=A0ABT4JSQ8_9GAMM|nr:hypothetical protein [Marinomonas sp. 15G1-11]MCZ2721418.1 hypothetical protein [Marinomonas sp. 15G1-11]
MKKIVLLAGMWLSSDVIADRLETPSYRIQIERFCDEGEVTCNKVRYYGVSKRSGHTLFLMGESMHSLCKDGITPCRFLGYHFMYETFEYFVYESGLFLVKEKDQIKVEEQGEWH